MKKVITTVGTSLFTNYLQFNKDINTYYESLKDLPNKDWDKTRDRVDRIRKPVSAWVQGNQNASAEIKSTGRIKEELNEELEVHLLATDTVLSHLAAEIIAQNLKDVVVCFQPQRDVVPSLQVKDRREFEKEGLPNLIERLYDLWGGYSGNVILNITGGYKGVIPYLTIMGQVNGIPSCYIFEDTDELIWIPQAPLDISYGVFERYSHIFEQLQKGIAGGWDDFKRRNNIGGEFQSCIWEAEDMAELNPIGKMLWERYQRFFVVRIPSGSKYFFEEASRKQDLDKAIQILYYKLAAELDNFQKPLTSIKRGNDLCHVDIDDSSVYKHTNPHIRIQYGISENKTLTVYNYEFKADNENYSGYFKARYNKLKNGKFRVIPFEKKTYGNMSRP